MLPKRVLVMNFEEKMIFGFQNQVERVNVFLNFKAFPSNKSMYRTMWSAGRSFLHRGCPHFQGGYRRSRNFFVDSYAFRSEYSKQLSGSIENVFKYIWHTYIPKLGSTISRRLIPITLLLYSLSWIICRNVFRTT